MVIIIGGDHYHRIIGGDHYYRISVVIIIGLSVAVVIIIVIFDPESSQHRPKLVPESSQIIQQSSKSTQNLSRFIPKSFRIHLKFDSESSQHRPNISISISIQNRPEIDSEFPHIHSESSQNRFRIFPKSIQNRPNIDSESSQHRFRRPNID